MTNFEIKVYLNDISLSLSHAHTQTSTQGKVLRRVL